LTRQLLITKLRQRGVRNLLPAELDFSPQLNILWGDNGQGKTSLLEALVLATTSRSFRTALPRDLLQHGADLATAEVTVEEAGLLRHQRVELGRAHKIASVDGKRIARTADFAVMTPVVVFHPGDLNLVGGPAVLRRTLLSRVSLYLEPWSFESQKAYHHALRERQRLLLDRGVVAVGLEAFEEVAAEHGAAVTAANARAAQRIIEALASILTELAPRQLRVEAAHIASGSTDPAEFSRQLKDHRQRDLLRGRALYGPQRDDLRLSLDAADARRHASQGQQRLLALALKLAELSSIRSVRHVHPILLLDDVSSELDPERTTALLDWLRACPSQVFMTTTRWENPERHLNPNIMPRRFLVRGGMAEQEHPRESAASD
jgi:DNA replication and repair protein RecF